MSQEYRLFNYMKHSMCDFLFQITFKWRTISDYLPRILESEDANPIEIVNTNAQYHLTDHLICVGTSHSPWPPDYRDERFAPGNNFKAIFVFLLSNLQQSLPIQWYSKRVKIYICIDIIHYTELIYPIIIRFMMYLVD
jgi:hypothetical protein